MGRNPEASAVSMAGAQLCAIEDVTIRGDFHAGVFQMPGSGGGIAGLRVLGGRIGILQNEYRPNPLASDVILEGQSECGVKVLNARGPVILCGFRIVSPESPSPQYRAVAAESLSRAGIDHAIANLCLADGSIEVKGAGGTAIASAAQDTVLRNVYVKAATILECGSAAPPAMVVAGDPARWKRVAAYAYTSPLDKGSVAVDGVERSDRAAPCQLLEPLADEAPPAGLLDSHAAGALPSWEDEGVIDVARDFGATPEFGDGEDEDDDADRIQRAIDAAAAGSGRFGKPVFIPRGRFTISKPLLLKPGTRLIGAGKHTSVLQLSKTWRHGDAPAVDTADSDEALVVMSDIAILGYPCARLLRVRSGQTIVRDVQTETIKWRQFRAGEPRFPYVEFSGGAGGRIFNLSLDHVALDDFADKRNPPERGPDYLLLLIENTRNPLALYQPSIEHLDNSPQMAIRSCRNLQIHGLKFESRRELLAIDNSSNVVIFGGSGNYGIDTEDDRGIVVIRDSAPLFIANLNRRPIMGELPSHWIVDGEVRVSDAYALTLYWKR